MQIEAYGLAAADVPTDVDAYAGDLEEAATARAKRLGQDVRRRSRLRTT